MLRDNLKKLFSGHYSPLKYFYRREHRENRQDENKPTAFSISRRYIVIPFGEWAEQSRCYRQMSVIFLELTGFWMCKKHTSPDYARLHPGYTTPEHK